MRRKAEALAKTPKALPEAMPESVPAPEANALSLSEALAALHAHAVAAQQRYNGRELTLFESKPERVGRLIDLLVEGNYRDVAAQIAGIAPRAIRLWMEKAEAGDPRYENIAAVVRTAESLAESQAVRNVRAAGKDPRFWAAEMTYLERRHPEKWGRRLDEGTIPKVIVQIGVSSGDVQVNLGASAPVTSTLN